MAFQIIEDGQKLMGGIPTMHEARQTLTQITNSLVNNFGWTHNAHSDTQSEVISPRGNATIYVIEGYE